MVMPVLAERDLPFAMMIGVTRREPGIRLAGDMLGMADVSSVMTLCRDFPENRFLCTMLARENQHELAVAARKFGNLMVFGCWWFLNNPSLIEEITRMRMELLGPTFIPQHSDARVIDQLIYKWRHSREVIAKVLADKYADLADSGWRVTEATIRRDAQCAAAWQLRRVPGAVILLLRGFLINAAKTQALCMPFVNSLSLTDRLCLCFQPFFFCGAEPVVARQ